MGYRYETAGAFAVYRYQRDDMTDAETYSLDRLRWEPEKADNLRALAFRGKTNPASAEDAAEAIERCNKWNARRKAAAAAHAV